MAADGGPARRMTWLGPDVMVRGWTPEGHILFVTTYGQPFFRNYRAYTLDPAGGMPQELPLGQVNHLALRPGQRPRHRPQHRGSGALEALPRRHGRPPVDRRGGQRHVPPDDASSPATSRARCWLGGRVWYLSDADGVGNLHSCLPDGTDLRRHTDHDDYYARHAQTDGRRIVYQCGADIWLFDPASERTREGRRSRRRRTARRRRAGSSPRPSTSAARTSIRPATASRSTRAASCSRSRCGRARCASTAIPTPAATATGSGWTTARRWSPSATPPARSASRCSPTARRARCRGTSGASSRCAPRRAAGASRIANHRNEVMIGDVASRHAHASSIAARRARPTSSPGPPTARCSRTRSGRARATARSGCTTSRTGTSVLVTQPEFRDYCPAFDPDGKYLYFLSLRTFDPVYDAVQFELSLPARRAAVPDRAAGRRAAAVRSAAQGHERRRPGRGRREAGRGAAKPMRTRRSPMRPRRPSRSTSTASPAASRRSRFPRTASAGSPARPAARCCGRCCRSPARTAAAGTRKAPGRLEAFDFATLRTETLMDKADAFTLAADHTTLLVREGKRLRAIAANRAPETRRPPRRRPVAQERLDRPRPRAPVDRAAQRMAADAARSLAAAARPVLGAGHVGRRLGRGAAPLRAAARARGHARRALRPDLGDAGRARHVARLRDRAATTASRRRSRSATWRRTCACVEADGSYEITRIVARRRLGCGRRFAAARGRRRGARSASGSSPSTASACRASGRRRRCSCTRPAPRSS